jgi:hypothetical protein
MSEDREGTATPGSEGTERSTPEEGRGFRRECCDFVIVFCEMQVMNIIAFSGTDFQLLFHLIAISSWDVMGCEGFLNVLKL